MTLEIEAKIKVESLESVARRLKAVEAHFVAEQVQSDAYFLDAAGTLTQRGCGLRPAHRNRRHRNRFHSDLQRPAAARPLQDTPRIRNACRRCRGNDPYSQRFSHRRCLTVDKTRCLWELEDCEVCLDTVPPLGCFVEVEGPDDAAIKNVLIQLNLADQPHITEGYAAMMARLKRKPDTLRK